MKRILFILLAFVFTQPALSFVGISGVDLENERIIKKNCSLSENYENPCDYDNPLILGGEGGGRPPNKSEENQDSLEGTKSKVVAFELKRDIKELILENDGVFDMGFILQGLQEKRLYLTEEDVLEIYEQRKFSDIIDVKSMNFSMKSERIAGGEGGN